MLVATTKLLEVKIWTYLECIFVPNHQRHLQNISQLIIITMKIIKMRWCWVDMSPWQSRGSWRCRQKAVSGQYRRARVNIKGEGVGGRKRIIEITMPSSILEVKQRTPIFFSKLFLLLNKHILFQRHNLSCLISQISFFLATFIFFPSLWAVCGILILVHSSGIASL